MKYLQLLADDEVEGFDTFDGIFSIGEPQQPVDGRVKLEWLLECKFRGVYTTDDSILGWDELLAQAKANFQAGKQEWLKATMMMGNHMLNCVPPALMRGGGFATGEPYTHDGRGRAVYLCFIGFDWKKPTCQAQYFTIPDFIGYLTKK